MPWVSSGRYWPVVPEVAIWAWVGVTLPCLWLSHNTRGLDFCGMRGSERKANRQQQRNSADELCSPNFPWPSQGSLCWCKTWPTKETHSLFFFFFLARPSLYIHLWEKGHLKVSETISNLLASGFDSGRAHWYAFLARSTNSQHFFVCPCCTRNVGAHDRIGLLA